MAEKLSESSWSSFAKKRDLDDAALVKALSRFDKTDANKPEPRLEALQEVEAQIAKQVLAIAKRKKELGDKPWKEAKDKLDALLAETERLIKETRAKAAAASAQANADAEDEADSPALLTTKMIPLLRELRKPEILMHALIATAGKNTAVLIMRRAISAGRRKLLAEAVDAKGGVKYIVGECLYEKNALTFVVQTQASGLAKRLRAALLEQTGLRLKVRVRGEDGEVDDDGEGEGDAVESGESESEGGTVDPLKARFESRSAALAERVAEALRNQQGDVGKLRALNAFATEKGGAGQYAAALQALDAVEKLLAASGTAGGEGKAPGGAVDYAKARLDWLSARKDAEAALGKLEKEIVAAYKDDAEMLAEIKQGVRRLDKVMKRLDESLADKLDEGLNAADPQRRTEINGQAREIIEGYLDYLDSDELVEQIADNPFTPVDLPNTVGQTLRALARQLA